jgi:hypothetical protein
VLGVGAAVGGAERAVRHGPGVQPQPRRDVHSQDPPTTGRPGQGHPGQRPPQPGDIEPAAVQAGVVGTVTPAVLGRQGEADKRPHLSVGAQHRVGQLEQRVGAGGQAVVEVGSEPGQHGQGLDPDNSVQQTHPRGLGMINSVSTTRVITPGPHHARPGPRWSAGPQLAELTQSLKVIPRRWVVERTFRWLLHHLLAHDHAHGSNLNCRNAHDRPRAKTMVVC